LQLPIGVSAARVSDEAVPMSWSSDGQKLAFSVVEQGSKNMGYIVDTSGNLLMQSESLYGYVYWPSFSK
jgi:Tol biopolymer transport system component